METDVITYGVTINACENGYQWMAAVALLGEAQKWHMKPTAITYDDMVSMCIGVTPNVQHHSHVQAPRLLYFTAGRGYRPFGPGVVLHHIDDLVWEMPHCHVRLEVGRW